MYRPNRIGGAPFLNIDRAPLNLGTIATSEVEATFSPIVADATVRTSTASRQIRGVASVIQAAGQFSFGIALAGDNPIGDLAGAGDIAVQYEVFGQIRWRETAGVNLGSCTAILARNNAATVNAPPTINPCTNYQMIPLDMEHYTVNGGIASFKTSVLLGNFDGAITYTDDPLILAWIIHNPTPATAIAVNFNSYLAIHKYIVDIDTLDPSRQ